MMRTKWMRLGVRDPADILRWAGEQNTRQLDEFRHRIIHGREFVSFRLVPRYRVELGTSDIIVVAHVKPTTSDLLRAAIVAAARKAFSGVGAGLAVLRRRTPQPNPAASAALYDFAALRVSLPSRR